MIDTFKLYKAYIMAALFVAVLVAQFIYVRGVYVNEGDARVQAVELMYQTLQAQAAAALHAKENQLAELNQQMETQNVNAKRKVEEANRRYSNYVSTHGLRDPGTAPVSRPGANTSAGSANNTQGAQCNRELSKEASGFLLELTREADELKEDYATCINWTNQVKSTLGAKPKSSSTDQQ